MSPSRARFHRRLIGALAVTLAVALFGTSPAHAKRTDPPGVPPTMHEFDTAAAALLSLLADRPQMVAFGEYHETKESAHVRSAIVHFTDELLATIAPLSSDLVVETWVTEGSCGKQEKAVVAQVEETTKRPETTESEVVKLIKRAKALGVQPHILTVGCKQYQALLDKEGEVDYVRLLLTITELLKKEITQALGRKRSGDRIVLAYGGALHNDLYPRKELRDYTFGAALEKSTHGRYLEVDLYVPEYIARDKDITQERWYPLLATRDATKTALVRRGPASYIIVFSPSAKAAQPAP